MIGKPLVNGGHFVHMGIDTFTRQDQLNLGVGKQVAEPVRFLASARDAVNIPVVNGIVDRRESHFAGLAPDDFHYHDVTRKRVAEERTKSKPEHGDHKKLIQKPKDSAQKWGHEKLLVLEFTWLFCNSIHHQIHQRIDNALKRHGFISDLEIVIEIRQ